VAIYRIKKSSEARERSRKPWGPVEEEPGGDTEDFTTPTPFGDQTV
jgi:hypothetical protein